MSKILRCLHLFGIFSFILLASCGADLNKKPKALPVENALGTQCSCNTTYSPVCGSDGRDYDNICMATCFKATEVKQGSCDCLKNNKDVCGDDGNTYKECVAQDMIAAGTLSKIVKFADCAATVY
jgi:hypothetical protein